MRGQWQSQTRRLNRHYQSGGGEPVPWTLFDTPYDSDMLWSNWNSGRGFTRIWSSPYNQTSTETYKCGTDSLSGSSAITGTSIPLTCNAQTGWDYYLNTQKQFWDERTPIVPSLGRPEAGATVRENGPKNLQNRLWLISKGKFRRNKLIRCRITIMSTVNSGIEPEYYILRFRAGADTQPYHFYCGDQIHYGNGTQSFPNPDTYHVLMYWPNSLSGPSIGEMRNDNYQTAQTGHQFYTKLDQSTWTYGKKLVDQDAQGRYYIEYILDPRPVWAAFDALDPTVHANYDRFAFGFDYGIESIATAADMELRSMIQFWEEDIP